MQIISFINVKGGAGKSTLACCVAAEIAKKHPVTLIDADPQGGAAAWVNAGEGLGIELIIDADESAAARARQASKRSVVLVDLAGFATQTMIATLAITDRAVIPCRASALDAHKALETESIINKVREATQNKISSLVVMNGVTRTVITPHIRAELTAAGLSIAKTEIGQRTAFAIAGLNGSAPCYMGSSAKVAAAEIQQLTKELLK